VSRRLHGWSGLPVPPPPPARDPSSRMAGESAEPDAQEADG
jgi:hypothetical protein